MPTIVAKRPGKCRLGQRDGFSATDVRKLNTLYKCAGLPGGPAAGGGGGGGTEKPRPLPSCRDRNK